jgi:uncharacterized protein YqeY
MLARIAPEDQMLRDKLNNDVKEAMKAKEPARVSTLRMIQAGIKDRDIAARSKGVQTGIGDDEILSMLTGMIKQRRDSIALYEQGNRPELAQKEKDEIALIESYMPKQLDEAGVQAAIAKAKAETGAASVKDMGAVMSWLKANYAGQMDFAKAAQAVRASLT